MARNIPDDISDLFRYAGIDPTVYQQFAHPRFHTTGQPTTASPPAPPAQVSTVALETNNPTPPSVDPTGSPPIVSVENGATAEEQVQECSLLHLPLDPYSYHQDQSNRPTPRALAFHSVAGGGGSTTILATLARAFSKVGERVLMVDSGEFSTLPLYFGGQQLSGGSNTIVFPKSAPIQLQLRESNSEGQYLSSEVEEKPLWHGLERVGNEVDRVLMEIFHLPTQRTEQWLWEHGVTIIVIVPDMRSAVGVQRVARYFREREEATNIHIPKYFLLNKFDPKSKLSIDMRQWLTAQLGDALLPFVLRRDEKVEEALVEGLTVLDYAPDSAAAEDFMQLVEWLRRMKF